MSLNNNLLKIGGGKRLAWIDQLKGFTILGVIFVHANGHPEWWTANHVNTIFFFLAGMFFKPRPFGEFVRKNAASLLIPFLFFFLLSYPFRILVELWDTRSFDAVTWNMLLDVFKVDARSDYLYANVPLWFIFCLFFVQVVYWGLSKCHIWLRAALLACVWLFWEDIYNFPTPFMINNAVCWTLYFGLGSMLKDMIMKATSKRSFALAVAVCCAALMFMTDALFDNSQATNIFYILWCLLMVAVASVLGNLYTSRILEFLGTNTLVILGAHLWFLIPIGRVHSKIFQSAGIYEALIMTALCAAMLVPVIITINKHLPFAAGKRKAAVKRDEERHQQTDLC